MNNLQNEKGSLGYLVIISLITTIGGFSFGFDTTIASGAIGFIKNQFALNTNWEGWVVSSALFGCIAGSAVAGPLTDKFGRKIILILAAIFLTVSCIWCIFPSSASWLVVARIIGGLGIGITSMAAPVYISEIAPAKLRGRLVSFYQLSITLGILFAFLINTLILYCAGDKAGVVTQQQESFFNWVFVSQLWRGMLGTEAIPAVLFLVLLFLIPESPRWLAEKDQYDDAMNVLVRINGKAEAEKEMRDINEIIHQQTAGLKQLFEPVFRRPLMICIMLPVFAHLTGIAAILYFAPKILTEAGLSLGGSFGASITIGLINCIFTFLAIWKIDNFGRRPLLLGGIFGSFLSLLLVGILFRLNITHKYLVLIPILTYIACFAFSFGPGVWVVISEVFPTRTRGIAVGVGALALWITAFAVSQTLPKLIETVGAGNTFLIYAFLTAPALWFVYSIIPETKGKTLEEIEKHWLNIYTQRKDKKNHTDVIAG
ncbi:MAG: sugar porter family MFS transporter [Phycisphaerales bacterium]